MSLMEVNFHKKIGYFIFIYFILIALLTYFNNYIALIVNTNLLQTVCYLLNIFVILIIIYFGIYINFISTKKSKIRKISYIYIFLGLLFLFIFILPVAFGYIYHNYFNNYELILNKEKEKTYFKMSAQNSNIPLSQRLNYTKKYYKITGKPIKYLNSNEEKILFVPKKEDKIAHKKFLKKQEKINAIIQSNKIKFYSIIILIIISILFFKLFLLIEKRRK